MPDENASEISATPSFIIQEGPKAGMIADIDVAREAAYAVERTKVTGSPEGKLPEEIADEQKREYAKVVAGVAEKYPMAGTLKNADGRSIFIIGDNFGEQKNRNTPILYDGGLVMIFHDNKFMVSEAEIGSLLKALDKAKTKKENNGFAPMDPSVIPLEKRRGYFEPDTTIAVRFYDLKEQAEGLKADLKESQEKFQKRHQEANKPVETADELLNLI